MARTPDFKRNRTLPEVVGSLARPKLPAETGWWRIGEDEPLEIPWETAWENADDPDNIYPPTAFYTSDDGEVRNRGVIDFGDTGEIVYIYPEEARPEFYQSFTCRVIGGGSANVGVYPNGEMIVEEYN